MIAGKINQSVFSIFFKAFFVSLCIIANVHFAYATDQGIIPPAKTTFFDNNGNPLASGKVYSYVPSTTTPKTTYQDFGGAIANTNPVTLDGSGRTLMWGTGQYRQVVKDRNGNTVWDQVTSAAGSGSSGTSTATGDGDLVGTIKPWAGMTAPNQYMFTYGQEVSRTTYSTLYTAITSMQSVFCNAGSPILNGVSDTTNFWIGMSVELSCLPSGFSTVVSKTISTITLAANANTNNSVNATFFPWGRGNGTTTFNLPDFRGVVPAGNNNMGGVASANLTTTFFGSTNPNSAGASGGSQSVTLADSNLVSTIPSGTIANGAISITQDALKSNASSTTPGGGFNIPSNQAATITATQATSTFTGQPNKFGGIAVSATVVVVGSGYTNGSQAITVAGGTCTTQPQFTVTVSGNVFTGTPALLTAGSCTTHPTNPAATTGGGGTGGTLNVSYSAQPFSLIQPTLTTNYIIKVTPDTNSATASGVTSLGAMTGDIACGSGLICTGNTISSLNGSGTVTSVGFTGGLLSVAMPTTTPSFTVAGTSGGIPYFNSSSTWASSAALTANAPVIGGGAGVAPTVGSRSGNTTTFGTTSGVLTNGNCVSIDASGNFVDAGGACTTGGGGGTVSAGTIGQIASYAASGTTVSGATTGTGVLTALAINVGTAGAFVKNGAALGTPSSGTLTSVTGLPVSTGISGLGTSVATALAVNVGSAGAVLVNGGVLGTPSSGTLTNATGLPIAGVTGLGTGVATALGTTTGNTNGMVTVIAKGTLALRTSAISAGVCGTVSTATATGTVTTDITDISFNGDPTAITGYVPTASVYLVAYPTADTFNIKQCNNTGSSITPSALTINWAVRR